MKKMGLYILLTVFTISCKDANKSPTKKDVVVVGDIVIDDNIVYDTLFKTLTIRNFKKSELPEKLSKYRDVECIQFIGKNNLDYGKVFWSFKDVGILRIEFIDSSLKETLSDSIGYLSQIRYLKINNCDINAFPVAICKIDGLLSVDLSITNINNLPNCFFDLELIEEITITNTKVDSISPEVNNLTQLTLLNIENTQISTLPQTLVSCKKLRHLSIGNTPISSRILDYIKATKQNEFDVKDYGELEFINKELPSCNIHLRLKPMAQDDYAE